jgi:putative membrane protein
MNIPKPINPNNELAKKRNQAAAERTLLAWVRRCLSLITFGVRVFRFLCKPLITQ